MKKKENAGKGGIRRKYLRLILIVMAVVAAGSIVMNLIQMKQLSSIVNNTSAKQFETVSLFAIDAMDLLADQKLAYTVETEATNVSDVFNNSIVDSVGFANYVQRLFEHPEHFSKQRVMPPLAANEGKLSVQLLTEEGVDTKSPELKDKIETLGGLTDFLLSFTESMEVESVYVAVPEGVMLMADSNSGEKLDENGKPIHIPIREREWYTAAAESKEIYSSNAYQDIFTGNYVLTISAPVLVGGEVVAVVAADVDLAWLNNFVNDSYEEGELVCILDQDGRVLFSPFTSGILGAKGEEGEDLRKHKNGDIAAFMRESYEKTTDLIRIEQDGKEYCMVGAPIYFAGWAMLHAMDAEALDEMTQVTTDEINTLMTEAQESLNQGIVRSIILIVVLLIAVLLVALFYAGKVSGRIVDPLETMTKRLGDIKGEDLLFEMEDTYRTGDEIEVLAETFSDMSARTLQYVDQVKTVTAEKERIGAELNMATAIQASQLPRLFPAFPEREEFKLHASMHPAKEVGGDFYDFYFVDHDHIALIMADVSGKGVPAALFMMVSRVLIKSRLQNGESPGEALRNVNDQLCENNEAGLFVTVWAAVIEISTGKGISVNAGHEHPALRRGNGPFELVEYEHSLAVAAFEGMPFDEREFELHPGDAVFVYTDGVAEAQNADHVLFDMDRMLQALNRDPMAEPETLIENVKKGIDDFVDGAEQFDDITMLAFQYDGAASKE